MTVAGTRKPDLIQQIADRRERLGMSFDALARRSGVSAPTLKRMMAGRDAGAVDERGGRTSLRNVHAVAAALGMRLSAEPDLPVDALCERQAEALARELVDLVQGTSALEVQGLDAETIAEMVEDAKRQLLDGPRRKLWGGRVDSMGDRYEDRHEPRYE